MQAWGLIVLLVSKAAGHSDVDGAAEEDNSGVLRSQRALAEIAEMIRTSHLMHSGLMNIYPSMFPEPAARNDMCFGNKIALLSGDYLLANSYNELSMLRRQDVSGTSSCRGEGKVPVPYKIPTGPRVGNCSTGVPVSETVQQVPVYRERFNRCPCIRNCPTGPRVANGQTGPRVRNGPTGPLLFSPKK